MDSGNRFPAASGFTGQAPPGATRADISPVPGPLTIALREGLPDEEAPPLTLLTEWALWGKDQANTGYHIMHCSRGELTAGIFSEIITRYGSGVKPSLPQCTVCWIPDRHGRPEYLAVAIHEIADRNLPSHGGRSRNVGGRIVEYVRLFCFRFADVAEFGASYTDLVRAVRDIPLLPGEANAGLIPVTLPPVPEVPTPDDAEHQLAQNVALALLARAPVCVLDADGVSVMRRLAFIDQVMSLLPFGLRATLSASTWASTTVQDLKLRLYFSNAPMEDGGRTSHVQWARPGQFALPPDAEAARLYRDWLREARPGAIDQLVFSADPLRFTETDELQMLSLLPSDKTVADTLAELSPRLDAADQAAVSAIVRRLKRHLGGQRDTADRALCRSLILKNGLFRDAKLNGNVKKSVYRMLLSLGFDTPLSYAGYLEIEDSVGSPPGWFLRQVLLDGNLDFLGCVHVALAGPGYGNEQLRETFLSSNFPAVRLLSLLEQEIETIRPRHRQNLIDFTLWYLSHPPDVIERGPAENPKAELLEHGLLTDLLARAFSRDQTMQEDRLAGILRYVYGERLSPGDIRQIFEAPGLYPSPAIEAAVARLGGRRSWGFVAKQAAAARLRYAGHGEDVAKVLRTDGWRRPWPTRNPAPRRNSGSGTAKSVLTVAAGLVIAAIVVVVLFVVLHGP